MDEDDASPLCGGGGDDDDSDSDPDLVKDRWMERRAKLDEDWEQLRNRALERASRPSLSRAPMARRK